MFRSSPTTPEEQLVIAQFAATIATFDHMRPDCKESIASFRQQLDAAFETRAIPLHHYRLLWEAVSAVQAKYSMVQAGGWRIPREDGGFLAYVPPPPALRKR
jgi:hypothetical protein